MKSLFFLLVTLTIFNSFAQMSENQVSDMCMNQIVAGMATDKVLGKESGICVKFNKDSYGNISGMDFKMNTSAFELGKDQLQDEAQKKRIQTIKDFVLNYQKLVTKNNQLKIDDVDIQVRSYADGVAGPTSYDKEIQNMSNWSDLLNYIGNDKAGVKHIQQTAPASKNGNNPVNFNKLSSATQSTIRNIVLAKRRSDTICKEFGISNCSERENSGFSSPDLEKRNPNKRNCDERRVSVISVNLNKAASVHKQEKGTYHPSFAIPSGEKGEELKNDMQIAGIFDIIKKRNDVLEKYSTGNTKKEELDRLKQIITTSKDARAKAEASKKFNAISALDNKTFNYLVLPEEASSSPQYRTYAGMMNSLTDRYGNFVTSVKANFPDLLPFVEKGDFYSFKENITQIKDKNKIKKMEQIQRALLHNNGNPDTDMLNFFSSSEALKYHYAHDENSPQLVNAATLVNQSNGNLDIVLDQKDLGAAKNRVKDDGRAHWMCYGGCESGVHENENGELMTKFRSMNFPEKSGRQVEKEFSSVPLGFGSLKTLSVYVIDGCSNCDCLKQRNADLDKILKGPQARKIAINKIDKTASGRAFNQTVTGIKNPADTCVYTPPVAHTCKVDPSGQTEVEQGYKKQTNYSCAMWDKSGHGLKWTANFIKDGLGLAENTSDVICHAKAANLKDAAQEAVCDFTDPKSVPDNCQ